MQVEKFDSTQERKVLISLVMDDQVAAAVAAKWTKEGLFASRWSNLVGAWCVQHAREYGKAARRGITEKFERWSVNAKGEEVEMVDRFLSSLSEEFDRDPEDFNPPQLIDLAGEHFNRVRLSKLAEGLRHDLESGSLGRAEERVGSDAKIELGGTAATEILADEGMAEMAFAEKKETSLIKYPGDLGSIFFQGQLDRDYFIAFMAPEKSYKSFWLHDVAWRAVMQKRRVLYFDAGDMSRHQVARRFYVRAAKHPWRSPDGKWPLTVKVPKSIEAPEKVRDLPLVAYDTKVFHEPLDASKAWEACQRIVRKRLQKETNSFRLLCYPTGTLGVAEIDNTVSAMGRHGFHPDVIVVDYADILASPYPGCEQRERHNLNWSGLRKLSLSKHALVVTATQADAASYDTWLLRRGNFSEDKRKIAHANGIVGINVSPEERRAGVCRLNWPANRELELSEDQCIYVAGCLALSNPALVSTF